jgi:hypothetical protein
VKTGEGRGEGPGRKLATTSAGAPESHYRVENPLDVPADFVVAEASHPVALIVQELFTRAIALTFILGRMSGAVDLDDKFFFAADEVGEIWTNRLLPDELEPAESAVSKSLPKPAFSLGLVSSQPPSSARFVQVQSAHRPAPHPNPLPVKTGRGNLLPSSGRP